MQYDVMLGAVGLSTGTAPQLTLRNPSTEATIATGSTSQTGDFWGGLFSLGTHVVDAVGNVQLAKLQGSAAPQQTGFIPGTSKAQSYMILGGIGVAAVLIIAMTRR